MDRVWTGIGQILDSVSSVCPTNHWLGVPNKHTMRQRKGKGETVVIVFVVAKPTPISLTAYLKQYLLDPSLLYMHDLILV